MGSAGSTRTRVVCKQLSAGWRRARKDAMHRLRQELLHALLRRQGPQHPAGRRGRLVRRPPAAPRRRTAPPSERLRPMRASARRLEPSRRSNAAARRPQMLRMTSGRVAQVKGSGGAIWTRRPSATRRMHRTRRVHRKQRTNHSIHRCHARGSTIGNTLIRNLYSRQHRNTNSRCNRSRRNPNRSRRNCSRCNRHTHRRSRTHTSCTTACPSSL
mmetsp:Transcript_25828/g.54145  ORF Transcript_25828/g.54145 Transcript_25828/m.54145 type:complete len:214 (+) Transcript_25828:741-1382(+)